MLGESGEALQPGLVPSSDESAVESDERWPDVLDRLEDGLAEALTAMDRPAEPFAAELWIPPSDMGPLPPELESRVLVLIEAKAALRGRMSASQDGTIKRLAALASVPKNMPVSKPVYLDVSG